MDSPQLKSFGIFAGVIVVILGIASGSLFFEAAARMDEHSMDYSANTLNADSIYANEHQEIGDGLACLMFSFALGGGLIFLANRHEVNEPGRYPNKSALLPATQKEAEHKCDGCGASVKASDKYCNNCGEHFKELVKGAKAQAKQIISQERCPSCGAVVSESQKFCPHCAVKLPKECSNCGAAIKPDWQVCPECGTEILTRQQNEMPKV